VVRFLLMNFCNAEHASLSKSCSTTSWLINLASIQQYSWFPGDESQWLWRPPLIVSMRSKFQASKYLIFAQKLIKKSSTSAVICVECLSGSVSVLTLYIRMWAWSTLNANTMLAFRSKHCCVERHRAIFCGFNTFHITLSFKSLGSPRQFSVFHENSHFYFFKWIAKWI